MNLGDKVEMLPGVVISADDPEKIGRIKCIVPTLFEDDNPDNCLWIYPLCMSGNQSFSKLNNGDKVWVLNNKENYYEYWYFPMFELREKTKEINNYNNSDVFLSRENNGKQSLVYYNDDEGYNIQIGKTNLNVTSSNEIHCKAEEAEVSIKDNNVYLGTGDSSTMTTPVREDKLVKLLTDLTQGLNNLALAANGSWTTVNLVTGIKECISAIDNNIDDLKANTVHIN